MFPTQASSASDPVAPQPGDLAERVDAIVRSVERSGGRIVGLCIDGVCRRAGPRPLAAPQPPQDADRAPPDLSEERQP